MQKLEEYMGPVVSTTPCCKLKQQVFLFLPLLPIRKAVLSFAIRRSFACGEGALAATAAAAAAAAAAAVRCSFSLIISVLILVAVCLLCCLCVILALLLLYYSRDS